eukprot:603363-Hanusia_phi.AAC.2
MSQIPKRFFGMNGLGVTPDDISDKVFLSLALPFSLPLPLLLSSSPSLFPSCSLLLVFVSLFLISHYPLTSSLPPPPLFCPSLPYLLVLPLSLFPPAHWFPALHPRERPQGRRLHRRLRPQTLHLRLRRFHSVLLSAPPTLLTPSRKFYRHNFGIEQ